ncbi:CHAP domain-containing protein [Archangium lansingense]|uniref:CHAP domain-containing protein n=1 Tax=Archangium lansingense TaxID=2995310 RepID=UPI003B80F7EE
MALKIQSGTPVLQPRTAETQARPSAPQPQTPSAATGFSSSSGFSAGNTRRALSLDGAPQLPVSQQGNTLSASSLLRMGSAQVPVTGSGAGAGSAGGAAEARNPYDPTQEFEYALHSTFEQFGPEAAAALESVIAQIQAGQTPSVSTAVPQVGDVMVWGPNAGSMNSSVGQADQAGHMGVVQGVTDNGDGTVTVRVAEQNWNDNDGTQNGVPFRDIRLSRNPDGTLSLPNGVGFVPLNPNAPVDSGAPAPTGTQGPALGPNTTIDNPNFQIHNTPAHSATDPYRECVGYIHDMPQYKGLIENLAMANAPTDTFLEAEEIPTNTRVPAEGSLIVWDSGAGDDIVGSTNSSLGHVGYVEDVIPNYDPPGDPNGDLLSYTVTISEANASGTGNNDRSLRTFTVEAEPDGEAALPSGVGFYNPSVAAGGTPSTNPVGGSAPIAGQPVTRGQNYSVQSGDTLSSIAARAGVTVQDLINANQSLQANPDFLSIGQSIYIP